MGAQLMRGLLAGLGTGSAPFSGVATGNMTIVVMESWVLHGKEESTGHSEAGGGERGTYCATKFALCIIEEAGPRAPSLFASIKLDSIDHHVGACTSMYCLDLSVACV